MQESEEQYASRFPRRNSLPSDKLDDTVVVNEPSEVPARASRTQSRRPMRRAVYTRSATSLLPQRGLSYALIAGVIAGILDVLLNVVIRLSNSTTYQQMVREGNVLTSSTATTVFSLLCLSLLLNIIIFAVTGYIVGKISVRRRLGFLAGMLIGAIAYLISFLVRYIPNYPGNTATSGATNVATLGTALLFLLLSALIGGLISLFGTWLATRKHAYYTA